ncbi:hypothetical protein Tco_1507670 [Tanacetum coccineum]
MLLAQAQEAGVILQEKQQDFLADGLEDLDSDCDDLQLHTTSIFKADHVDAFDSYYDEAPTASAIFMARLSPAGSINRDVIGLTYDSDILYEVPHYDTYHETDMLNLVVKETEYSKHLVHNNDSYDELMSNNNVISYAEYMITIKNDAAQSVPSPKQDNAMILSVIEQMQSQVEQCNTVIEKCSKVLAPGLLRTESEPINVYTKNNRAMHQDYLKVTKEHVATLQELLEHARALKPFDENLDYASKQNTQKTDNTLLPSTGRVRILQKSQENGQNRTNTDTGKEREYKSRENAIKGQQKSTLGQN